MASKMETGTHAMTSWIYPANTKFYDVLGALSQSQTYLSMNSNVLAGDTIYIYLSAPYKQIGFVCEVLQINIDEKSVLEKTCPFFRNKKHTSKTKKIFMRLRCRSRVALRSNSPLAYHHLKENGLNGMLMGPRKLENNPALLDYIRRHVK